MYVWRSRMARFIFVNTPGYHMATCVFVCQELCAFTGYHSHMAWVQRRGWQGHSHPLDGWLVVDGMGGFGERMDTQSSGSLDAIICKFKRKAWHRCSTWRSWQQQSWRDWFLEYKTHTCIRPCRFMVSQKKNQTAHTHTPEKPECAAPGAARLLPFIPTRASKARVYLTPWWVEKYKRCTEQAHAQDGFAKRLVIGRSNGVLLSDSRRSKSSYIQGFICTCSCRSRPTSFFRSFRTQRNT